MSRRNMGGGSVGGGGASGAAWARMTGVTGFTTADYYGTGLAGGEVGAATGFGVAMLLTVTSQASTANRVLFGNLDGTSGYSLDGAGFWATITFSARNGAGGVVSSPSYTVTAADVGKVLFVEGYHDGSFLGLRVNRAEVGSPVAIVGYTPAVSTNNIGSRTTNFPATDTIIYGVCTYRGVKTLKQSQALADDAKALRDIPCGQAQAWSFKRSGGATPPASLVNQAGVDAMTRAGSALAYAVAAGPTFAY